MTYLIIWISIMEIKNINIYFSIVIPTFNHAKYINRCLDSLVNQTYLHWEALVINNYSTDNTIELVKGYNDTRIRLINFRNNGIIAASRNTGIREAKGEWICFLDSDDWWYSNKLLITYQHIKEFPHFDVVCHDLIMNKTLIGQKSLMPCGPIVPNLYYQLLKFGNRFPNSAVSVKRSVFYKYNIMINESTEAITVEDYDLSLRLSAHNLQYSCINIPLGEYMVETSNLSNTNIHLKNLESTLRKHVFEIQSFEPNKSKLWKEVSSRLNISKATASYHKNKYFDFINYFRLALKLSPKSVFRYVFDRVSLSLKRIRFQK